jgi:acyl-coenzyme A synthetase/AMP-(fatty) acid ligase
MDKMYQTGDYGRIVNGVLLYEGRTDSQIKVRGHRVDLTEVETAMQKLSDSSIDKLAVLCYKPGETEQVRFVSCSFREPRERISTMYYVSFSNISFCTILPATLPFEFFSFSKHIIFT